MVIASLVGNQCDIFGDEMHNPERFDGGEQSGNDDCFGFGCQWNRQGLRLEFDFV